MTHHTAARHGRGNSIPLRAGSALGVIALAITAAVFQGGAAVSAPVSAPAAVGPVVKAAPTAITGGAGHVRPQDDPDVVWFEDFENGQGDLPSDPPSRMGDYASIDGVTYQADAGWFDYNQCNGVVTSWSSATPVTSSPYAGSVQPIIKGFDWGVPSFPDDMCNTGGYRAPNMYTGPWDNYPQINVRRMADVLGQVAEGVDGAASPEAVSPDKSTDTSKLNHAVTE